MWSKPHPACFSPRHWNSHISYDISHPCLSNYELLSTSSTCGLFTSAVWLQHSAQFWQLRSVNQEGACLIGLCAAPSLARYRYSQSSNHMGSYREPFCFVSTMFLSAVSIVKRAQRDLSTSVKKCTRQRNQCLTQFSREIG